MSDAGPAYSRYLAPLIRPFPNFDFFFIKPIRQKAAQALGLSSGDRVLDAGCGSGGSFPFLVSAVGPAGEVVGLEISSGAATNARRRVEANRWENVQVLNLDARNAQLQGTYDGLLMFAAPDIFASPEALARLTPFLKSEARLVAFGAKLSRSKWAKLSNLLFRALVARVTFASTPALDNEPWKEMERYVTRIHVQEFFGGWMFLAWGTLASARDKGAEAHMAATEHLHC